MYLLNPPADVMFQGLSDQTRIRIMRIFTTFKKESCLCELVEALDEPQYNVSRHLKILRQSGILSSTKEGRWVYHELVDEPAYLRRLHSVINELPDPDKIYLQDKKRFQKCLDCRTGSRCKGKESESGKSSESRKKNKA